jgi:hypothetical protein
LSYQAVTWALKQPVQHSPAKFVLVAMAHYHQVGERGGDEPMRSWASTTTLVNATGQDRKTVLANIQRLIDAGYLRDTGEREGQTKSVVVYLLVEPESSPESGTPSKAQSGPKSGTAKQSQISLEAVPNPVPLSSPETGTAMEGEAVPISPPKQSQFSPEAVPVFPTEEVEKEKIEKENIKDIARRASAKRPLPDDFGVSERVSRWALEKGFADLPAHLEHFIGCAKARDYRYADWDQAFMNAIRDDWAKLRQRGRQAAPTNRHSIAERRQQEFLRLMGGHGDDGRTVDMEAA